MRRLDPTSWLVSAYTWILVLALSQFMPTDSVRAWGDISLVVMTIMVVTFTVFYATRSPFWKNRIGWIFMAKGLFLSAVLAQVSMSVVSSTGPGADYYPGRDYVRLFIYAGGAIAYAVMLAALLHMQRRDRIIHRLHKDS
ncbi:hypothetical protein SEA_BRUTONGASTER_43 [Gordonia phage BrutonGaster]|uniref:Holin n=1 Tax=Gordonia phage BrutonGaster TaxID=2530116 RepID=A0A482JMG2_9CAUD|nr:membrane protein [Gordonia phage BrutonGaster]QBP33260.1 hypothetical protein SEA_BRUTONGASTER_43 [Gordonia phage BrutonGaster]